MARRSRSVSPRTAPPTLTPAQTRSVLLEYRLGVGVRTAADVCAKYGLTPAALKRLGAGPPPYADLPELVLACIPVEADQPISLASLQGFLDYRDHAAYSEAELSPILEDLVARGLIVRTDGGWHLSGDAPLEARRFLFAPLYPEQTNAPR
jgi:hypothetical protein